MSSPRPPVSVSRPPRPSRTSLPLPPISLLSSALPTRVLARSLPEPVTAAPSNVRFSTLAKAARLRPSIRVWISSLPALTASIAVSPTASMI
ncbi:MAG: hypothetical protein C0484_08215 [Rhodospirillum sp.]|nr:hypothetical protein [Rhodospirillum sp.]